MIFGRSWMKKHRVLLNIIYDSIIFSSRFCTHLENSLSSIPLKLIEKTEKISEAKQQ